MNAHMTQAEFYDLQIEMAASGSVSGTLAEWPVLRAVLKAHGVTLPPETHAVAVLAVCRDLHRRLSNGGEGSGGDGE